MDEHAFKRYFFNIHTNNPEGEGIIKRFLSLARDIDIFIEATGNPLIGTMHAVKIINKKKIL